MSLKIAYFSAEIGFSPNVPTYSGGLGILAGDHLKSCADLGTPIVAITLLYKEGYTKQKLDENGKQTELYPRFHPEPILKKLPVHTALTLRNREVKIAVWQYELQGLKSKVPILFLDTDLPENDKKDREITLRLYSGGQTHRCVQEAVLGFGGIRILEKSGYNKLETFHMNEGHSSFLTLALREKFTAEEVKKRCVFTTHTPVPAGHDIFKTSLVKHVLGENSLENLDKSFPKSKLNLTHLALFYSRYTNGVSELNGEVARKMFPKNEISHITNGVHHLTWLGTETGKLFDKHLAGWREKPEKLREANSIPDSELWQAHKKNKIELLDYVNAQTQAGIEENCLLIGFARRAATYKRAALLFKDAERLAKIGSGKLAIVYAGKAHPKDSGGKELIEKVVSEAKKIFESVTVVYLENYNIWLGRLITAGVDVWLNTPQRPNEASGTSGMKATLNGIPNLSILDGWWAEACKNEVNGWAIGDDKDSDDETDANLLYDLLEQKVLPTYYENRKKWISLMKEAIVTAADFTAQRMVSDYCQFSYKI